MRPILLLAIAALAATGPARAEDCPPLALAASVTLQQAPGGRAGFVPVEIGGVPKLLLLDTGAEATLLTASVAKELGLETYRGNVRLFDVTGNYTDRYAITSLTIGHLKNDKVRFMVTPANLEAAFGKGIAGVLGADILGNLDLSIDFGTNKLDLLSQQHCEGKVVYWRERPLAVIPFKQVGMAQIIIPVTLDGHKLQAYVDSGATHSTIRRPRAERTFDLVMGSADVPASGFVNGDKNVPMWRHTFKSLLLEGLEVANPELDIIPDRVSEQLAMGAATGTRIDTRDEKIEPDMLLGLNVLKHLHVYVAYKEKRLYVTPSAASAGAPPK